MVLMLMIFIQNFSILDIHIQWNPSIIKLTTIETGLNCQLGEGWPLLNLTGVRILLPIQMYNFYHDE